MAGLKLTPLNKLRVKFENFGGGFFVVHTENRVGVHGYKYAK